VIKDHQYAFGCSLLRLKGRFWLVVCLNPASFHLLISIDQKHLLPYFKLTGCFSYECAIVLYCNVKLEKCILKLVVKLKVFVDRGPIFESK
jgi:hypothetical protein